MTYRNDNEILLQFDPDETIGALFERLGLAKQPVFLVAVDEDGRPFAAAAPGREMQKIPDGRPSEPVTRIIHLEHASWAIYEQNPRRSRTRIGGTTYDG